MDDHISLLYVNGRTPFVRIWLDCASALPDANNDTAINEIASLVFITLSSLDGGLTIARRSCSGFAQVPSLTDGNKDAGSVERCLSIDLYSNSGASSICGTSTSPLSVMRISGITDSGIRLKPI